MSRATEKGLECYNQNPASGKVEDLQLTGTGGWTASFTNAFKRGKGDLYLEKELVAATGFNPDELPEGTKFSFTIALIEDILDDVKVQVTYKGKEAKEETLDNGTLTVQMEADEHVTITRSACWKIPHYRSNDSFLCQQVCSERWRSMGGAAQYING